MGKLIDSLDLRPEKTSAAPVTGGNVAPVTRRGGSFSGTLSNWVVNKLSRYSEGKERENITDRARDLYGSDPTAAGGIDSLAMNIVGTGLVPQSKPLRKILGWDQDQARVFADSAELAFGIWSKKADARGRLTFGMIQLLSVYNLLIRGEFFRQPVMLNDPGREFSLALQSIDPMRVATPGCYASDGNVRDGIELGRLGEPQRYFVYNGSELLNRSGLSDSNYIGIPAYIAHRPGMLHGFVQKEDEQVRGVSVLAPAIEAFRNLSDYFEYEVVGAIIAAAFPVFIKTHNPILTSGVPLAAQPASQPPQVYYREYAPGGIYYGNEGEEPHILKNERPGGNFEPFIVLIKRTIAASMGMAYEVFAKDFSKSSYSAARAALLEAIRVYANYQMWLTGKLLDPVWAMVIEEAYLRGMLEVPKGSPDFYDAPYAYTGAVWIPPRRGHVDPVKEIQAMILAKDHNLMTLAQVIAELGGDWETTLEQREIEKRTEAEKNITPASSSDRPALAEKEETDEPQ